MFSSDNNIETIAQFVEQAKKYLTLKGEYLKLDIAGKAVRVLTVLVMTFVLMVVFMLALIFFSFALAFGLGHLIGNVGAFCIVGALYLILFVVCIMRRKSWIERPLVHFLASLFME